MFSQTEEKFKLLQTEVVQLDYVRNEMVDVVVGVVRDIAARQHIDTPQAMGSFLLDFFTLYFQEIGVQVSAEIFGMPASEPDKE
jgi:hypothetical protein